MNAKLSRAKPFWTMMLLMVSYGLVALFLGKYLQYNFLRSDVLGYWQDSLAWQTPFEPFHVPAYPLSIAIFRGITFGKLSPIGLMMGINLCAFLASAFFVYRIIQESTAQAELASIAAFLFGLWPFVGLTYTVDPLADMPAIFFLLSGFYYLICARRLPAALLLGLSLVTHKAMWLFVGLLLLADFLQRKEAFSKRNIPFLAILLLPLVLLWGSGSFYYHSVTWLFLRNVAAEVTSQGSLPVLDGLLGTFLQGGIKGWGKGILLLGFAGISGLTIYMSTRLKYEFFRYGGMIALAILVLFLFLNQHEIWAAMRFSRLLVIPLAFMANTKTELRKVVWWRSPITITVFIGLLISQFAFAWYMARVYFV